MRVRLKEIAEIRQGLAFRSKLEHEPQGTTRVVQAKDLGADGLVDLDAAYSLSAVRFKADQKLRVGDVLLQARGVNYPAARLDEDAGATVAAAPLYVLRVRSDQADPAYLVVFLSNPITQTQLRSRATGTYVPQLARAEIEDLEVPLPSLADQRQLVELSSLVMRERKLSHRLEELRSQVLWSLMRQAAEWKTQGRANAPGLRAARPVQQHRRAKS